MASSSVFLLLFLLWASVAEAASEDDVRCLRGLKAALSDPLQMLNWNFSNITVGFVCGFVGVTCWNGQENRVFTLSFPSMSLAGTIPADIQYCASVNNLDLSGNDLAGPIPSDLCLWLPYLVTLDLSGNRFSGPIPPSLSGCRFLNTLLLAGNELEGSIPPSLSQLNRLTHLNLSSNRLSGLVPEGLSKFDSSAFADNSDLCGRPVSSGCGKKLTRTSLIIIIAAGVFGAAASLFLAYIIWRICFASTGKRPGGVASGEREEGRWWAERLRTVHNRLVPVSLFQKPIVKVKVADLMAATADFHPDHIIVAGSSRTGTSYKAVLPDGSALTLKRLHSCPLLEKPFRAEMGRLGQLRHPNLVPLLGFCLVEDEKLLVYKHMPNGALSSALEPSNQVLDWHSRLRIAIGAARGLAWLHHGFQIPIIHQSLSSNAILLDEDYEARITDFGFSRLVRGTSAGGDSETRPFMNGELGELGYMAPEYTTTPIATTKGDVYAFGIILLELVTGQKPTEIISDAAGEGFKGSLVDWVNQLSDAGKIAEAIDRPLRDKGNDSEIMQVLKIAGTCVVAYSRERPSMFKVHQLLTAAGATHDYSEQFDEFPLVYGKDDSDSQ